MSTNIEKWKGKKGVERNKDKIQNIVIWLGIYDYSNQQLLSAVNDVNFRGQAKFFSQLESSGLVATSKAPGLPFKIYKLSEAGLEMARFLLPEQEIVKKKIPSWIYLVHSFSIQKAMLARRDEVEMFLPEKSIDGLKHKPDGIMVLKDGSKVALEVELSKKSNPRIFSIYILHLRNIRENHYDKVLYLFQNENLKDLYSKNCSEPIWPVYVLNEKRKLVLHTTQSSFDAKSSNAMSLFEFKTEDLYQL